MSPSIYLAFPLMLVLLILQVTISPHIQITGVEPQLLFLITVSWGLFFGLQPGLIWAFIAGIFIDLFSVGPAGASSLALMSAVAVAVLAKQLLPPNQILMPALLGGVASLVFWFVYIILLRVLVPVMIDSLDNNDRRFQQSMARQTFGTFHLPTAQAGVHSTIPDSKQ